MKSVFSLSPNEWKYFQVIYFCQILSLEKTLCHGLRFVTEESGGSKDGGGSGGQLMGGGEAEKLRQDHAPLFAQVSSSLIDCFNLFKISLLSDIFGCPAFCRLGYDG